MGRLGEEDIETRVAKLEGGYCRIGEIQGKIESLDSRVGELEKSWAVMTERITQGFSSIEKQLEAHLGDEQKAREANLQRQVASRESIIKAMSAIFVAAIGAVAAWFMFLAKS